jgi:glucose/arabinose dehydrogenase
LSVPLSVHAGTDTQSLVQRTPSIAPFTPSFYGGDKFPQWKNCFFSAILKAQDEASQ